MWNGNIAGQWEAFEMLEVASSEHARAVLCVRTAGGSGGKGLLKSLPLGASFVQNWGLLLQSDKFHE